MAQNKLQIIEGPNVGRELDVEATAVIGRDAGSADLVLEDPEASRRHAALKPDAPGLTIEDLGSTNGTYVNGERIVGTRSLVPGDQVRVGNTVLEVLNLGTAETRVAAAPEEAAGAPVLAGVSGGSPEQPPPPGGEPPPPPSEGAPGSEPPQPTAPEPPPAAPQPPPAATPPPGYAPQPGGPMVAPGGWAGPMQTRDSTVEWLLSAFVPFYSLYWVHRANKEMQAWSGGRIDYSAGATISALTIGWIILVPPIVAWVNYMGRIREAQRMAGLPQTASFWGSVGRALLLSYNIKWHQDQFNEIAVRQTQF
jgi:Inner membrane component of T3SS, cytoplasmic domain